MQSSTPSLTPCLPRVPFLFSPSSLSARFRALTDQRDPRGVRYPLPPLLTIAALAKLADQDAPRAIADRAQLRAPTLADRFGLDRPTMPHPTTWDRVSGAAIDPQRFARLVADFLASAAASARRGKRKRRGAVALCLDGETLRGTIPAGLTRGVHLLAAYLPAEGIVLIEVAVDGKENEIVTAREVLSRIDVHGCVVTGDAMSTQRKLSRQIRRNGGDYLRCVKEDRGRPHDDIAAPFALRAAAAPTAHDTPPLHALHDATG